jgi:WD40 repeat protein
MGYLREGRTLLVIAKPGSVYLCDLETNQTSECCNIGLDTPNLDFWLLACDSGGTSFACLRPGAHSVEIWSIETHSMIRRLEPKGEEEKESITSIACTPNLKTVITASGIVLKYPGNLRVWDAHNGTVRSNVALTGEFRSMYEIACSPDLRYLATGGRDGTVVVWDLAKIVAEGGSAP